jgi:hypothetical protein
MPALTKTDVAAFRKGDLVSVHLSDRHPNGVVRVVKNADRNNGNPFPQDAEHVVDAATVTVDGYGHRGAIESGSARCFGLVYLYHGQSTHASSVVKTLREGDEISFRFYPDGLSNQYVKDAGLHADVLYLDVRRNGKRAFEWKLVSSICPENTARMCQGFARRD